MFNIASGIGVTISGLTIEYGKAASGGGINNAGTLTLSSDTLVNNSAALGGGVYNSGTLTLSNVTESGNLASGSGSGIYSTGNAPLTITGGAPPR